jgi:phosphoribosylamine--glycine ligase
LAIAQDFKRIADGDAGPNTGGMGAYSPVPSVEGRLVDEVLDQAVEPLVAALRRRGIDYRGVLYAGLILTVDGPRVLEYNVRFGDPETQVVVPRLTEDLTGLLAEAAAGRLRTEPRFSTDAAVCVVLAAEHYPDTPRTGDPVEGLDAAAVVPGVTVLHAGTALDDQGRFVTAGGRVLGVSATGSTLAEARGRAYDGVARIGWEGMQHRTDIAAAAAATSAAGSMAAAPAGGRAR